MKNEVSDEKNNGKKTRVKEDFDVRRRITVIGNFEIKNRKVDFLKTSFFFNYLL